MNDPENYDLPHGEWIDAHQARAIFGMTHGAFHNLIKSGRYAIEWHDARPIRRIGIRQNRVRFYDVTDVRLAAERVQVAS